MACDDCERPGQRISPERLDERVKRLETKTHIGDVFAVVALVVLVCVAYQKLALGGVPLDG